jgi:hypothetical protein
MMLVVITKDGLGKAELAVIESKSEVAVCPLHIDRW